MNNIQKIILWIGIITIVLMGLFPPWHYKIEYQIIQGQSDYGYKFILTPVQLPNPDYKDIKAIINIRRLFIQCFIVGLITTGLIVTLQDPKRR